MMIKTQRFLKDSTTVNTNNLQSLTQVILHPNIICLFQQALFHQLLTQGLKSPSRCE